MNNQPTTPIHLCVIQLVMIIATLTYSSCSVQKSKKTQEKVETQGLIRSFNNKLIAKSKVEDFIKIQMDSLGMPGLSIAIINDDKFVYQDALGVKNVETQEKVDDNTMFDAASISKTVFSVYVMKMVDEGLLSLDVPLYTYMPYPDIAHDDRYKLITARMALSHTSGFPNWRYLDQHGNYNPKGKLTIQFEPGTQYQYSGEGYEYLAKTIAHLKGIKKNDVQKQIKATIFDPLGMNHSSFVWNDYLETHRADGHYRGKLNKGYSTSANDPDFKASASLQTASQEFALFLIALMNGTIVSPESQKELLKIQSRKAATENRKEHLYGLGIAIEKSEHGTNYAHGGDNLSSTGLYVFNTEKKVGYVFFTNSENKRKFNEKLIDFLLKN